MTAGPIAPRWFSSNSTTCSWQTPLGLTYAEAGNRTTFSDNFRRYGLLETRMPRFRRASQFIGAFAHRLVMVCTAYVQYNRFPNGRLSPSLTQLHLFRGGSS